MTLTKKQVCSQNKAVAYYSGLGGLELHNIEHGIEDYVYCVSGIHSNKKNYHKLKVYYSDDNSYIKFSGYKIPLNECIKITL